jgi:hypothetical protein
MSTYQEILESLERQYPGRIYLSVEQLANATGMAPGTVYNLTHRKAKKKLQIPVKRIGNRPKFRIHDVARFMAEL